MRFFLSIMRLSTIMPSTWHDICRLWTIICGTGIANLLMVIMILHMFFMVWRFLRKNSTLCWNSSKVEPLLSKTSMKITQGKSTRLLKNMSMRPAGTGYTVSLPGNSIASGNTKASAKTDRAIFSERQESSFTLNVEKLLGSFPRYPYNRILTKNLRPGVKSP